MMERRPGKKVTVADGLYVDGRAPKLSAEEERVIRMVHGARLDTTAPLEQLAGSGSELGDELSLIELRLFRSRRDAQRAPPGPATLPAAPADERAKSKIIRALRRKR